MTRLILIIVFCLSMIPITVFAEDRQWSSGQFPHTLGKGNVSSYFSFEMDRYHRPYSPNSTAKAVLSAGILKHWQASLELREDVLFSGNSLALLNQYEFLNEDNNPFHLRAAVNLKYRFLIDHQEISMKMLLAKTFLRERLTITWNLFTDNLILGERPLIYGMANQILWYFNQTITGGLDDQFRLDRPRMTAEWLIGPTVRLHLKTTGVPIYYMISGEKILRVPRSIHGVSLELKTLRGLTRISPEWVFSAGISLVL